MESKPYLDWQWEGRPAEGEIVQLFIYGTVTVGWWNKWVDEDGKDAPHWWFMNQECHGFDPSYVEPNAWKPLDPPPPVEFGWEVCINTAIYHNGEFKHNSPGYCTVIAPTADAAKKLVEVSADKEYTISDRLTVKTTSFIHGVRFLGRKFERVVVEFVKEDD
jgi:hypothetical protein